MNSMTGFGRANYENEGRNYIIDIKTVNNKYRDVNVKLPRRLSIIEEKIRKEVSNKISRGKIDIVITFNDFSSKFNQITLNKEIANEYIKQLRKIAKENDIVSNIDLIEIANLPDVLNITEIDNEEEITKETLHCLNIALDSLIKMREAEGTNIKEDFKERIIRVENIVSNIEKNTTGLVEEYVKKLEKRVKEILDKNIVDENRIAQEAVIYADKISIEEELTRLKSHINQFNELIENKNEPIGKKLDFIIQEMNRETNTIGSKSGNSNITNLVIDLKMELEDIREQIQNIE